ncbi:MAG: DUF5610 domain-containing protein [Candidatus Latescibacteria bacterium]|nr:DUF5610 domain-containing protein [Candidatus Latescibacterota bacterium]
MDVERIQSGQTLVAAIRGVIQGTGVSAGQLLTAVGGGSEGGDVLQLSSSIDAGYAQKVLKNSLAERLDQAFSEAGVDINTKDLLESGLDTSPEATAKRIVDFSTGFFEAFKNNNKDVKDTEQIDKFTALVKDAVKKGFEDAGQILDGIGQISGEVQGGIDQTFELAMKGIDDFAKKEKQSLLDQQAAAQKNGAAKKGTQVGVI